MIVSSFYRLFAFLFLTSFIISGCSGFFSKSVSSSLFSGETNQRILVPVQRGWAVTNEHTVGSTLQTVSAPVRGLSQLGEDLLIQEVTPKKSPSHFREKIESEISSQRFGCSASEMKDYFSGEERGANTVVTGISCTEEADDISQAPRRVLLFKAIEGNSDLFFVKRYIRRVPPEDNLPTGNEVLSVLRFFELVKLCSESLGPNNCKALLAGR